MKHRACQVNSKRNRCKFTEVTFDLNQIFLYFREVSVFFGFAGIRLFLQDFHPHNQQQKSGADMSAGL